jgi:hypothetical protein
MTVMISRRALFAAAALPLPALAQAPYQPVDEFGAA